VAAYYGHDTVLYQLRMGKDASVTTSFGSTVSADQLALAIMAAGTMGIKKKK
jgi:hypothetical protein